MTLPAKRWLVTEPDEAHVQRIAVEHDLAVPLARVLVNRGHLDEQEITTFLDPALNRVGDPFALPDMEKAVARIWQAIDRKESVLVFGDYDVDGVTSTTLLTRILDRLGNRPKSFIPHRITDGYGLTLESFEKVREKHAPQLIITVDCGTGSVEAVAAAQDQGIDVIVTDHHEASTGVAEAFAVVNPKLGKEDSIQMLAGVGVAFKLCHALLKQGRDDGRETAEKLDLRRFMHLVAMGTVADMVPLVGENRILAAFGIDELNRCTEPGIAALGKVAGIREAFNAYHVGFLLGPRINAAGRMDHSGAALDLLLTGERADAEALALALDTANRERQEMEKQMFSEAEQQIDRYFQPDETFGIVVANEGWHPGVVGIVASRLVQKYYRPVVVIGIDENGLGKGSCRSIDAFDLVGGLGKVSGHLERFGGHKMAAGLQIQRGHVDAFRMDFNRVAAEVLIDEALVPQIKIDAWLEPAEVNYPLCAQTERFMPFGLKNPAPVWAINDVAISDKRRVGDGHMKLVVDLAGRRVDAIAFNRVTDELPEGRVDLVFQLKINRFRGAENLQLTVLDFRAAT